MKASFEEDVKRFRHVIGMAITHLAGSSMKIPTNESEMSQLDWMLEGLGDLRNWLKQSLPDNAAGEKLSKCASDLMAIGLAQG